MEELLLRGGSASCCLNRGGGEVGVPLKVENRTNERKYVPSRTSVTAKDEDGAKKVQWRWPRKLCAGVAAALIVLTPQTSSTLSPPWLEMFIVGTASANGLLQMPPRELKNRYFLVRAGLSNFESMGVINTNPVLKTNVDNGLSPEGLRQSERAANQLKDMGACEDSCWIWPSITQRAYQAAEVIAHVNNITYSRIVPEYSFLDARGLGAYEGRDLSTVDEVHASDSLSVLVKPPPFTDGTPNESVADVLVRVTQLMSILETQYYGDAVVIVSPDSENLSILQAALTGKDLRRHSELAFAPGEVRRIDSSDLPAPKPLVSGKYKCATSSCK